MTATDCARFERPTRPFQGYAMAVMLLLSATAWGNPGDLDPSFGTGGIVTTDMQTLGTVNQTATAVIVQAGRIVFGWWRGGLLRRPIRP
jgi:hypothetical protein